MIHVHIQNYYNYFIDQALQHFCNSIQTWLMILQRPILFEKKIQAKHRRFRNGLEDTNLLLGGGGHIEAFTPLILSVSLS